MKKFFVSALCMIALVLVVGCGKSNVLIGTWKGSSNDGLKTTFVFDKDKKVSYENQFGFKSNGTYKIDGNKVTINLKDWNKEKVYEFVVKNKKLSLTATDNYSPSYTDMIKQ